MAHFVFYNLPPEAAEKAARLRSQIAGNRMLLAWCRLEALLAKQNFNPNEARVPAGNGTESGQWTNGARSRLAVQGDGTGSKIIPPANRPNNQRPNSRAGGPNTINSSLRVWPVPGFGKLNPGNAATQEGNGRFGSPRYGGRTHTGVDIQAPVGTPVVAAGDGKVIDLKPNPSRDYGNQVVIDQGNGVFTQSAHPGSVLVKPGETVQAGQTIGSVGRTGNVPKGARSHVHFEVRIGKPIPHLAGGTVHNPFDYLPSPPPAR